MQKLILPILLLIASPAFAFEPEEVSHFGTSAGYALIIGTITYHMAEQMGPVQRMLTSSGLAMVPGVAWEIKDEFSKDNYFSWNDLLVDGVGAVTGAIAAELINGQFWISASGRQIRLIGKW